MQSCCSIYHVCVCCAEVESQLEALDLSESTHNADVWASGGGEVSYGVAHSQASADEVGIVLRFCSVCFCIRLLIRLHCAHAL